MNYQMVFKQALDAPAVVFCTPEYIFETLFTDTSWLNLDCCWKRKSVECGYD